MTSTEAEQIIRTKLADLHSKYNSLQGQSQTTAKRVLKGKINVLNEILELLSVDR